jgi:hypothetical protein
MLLAMSIVLTLIASVSLGILADVRIQSHRRRRK